MPSRARLARVLASAFALAGAGGASADDSAAPSGKQVFTAAEPACSICHALADAGAAGRIGPSLDTLRPTADAVRNALHDGPGAMPTYGDRLSKAEIDAVAEYVASVAGE